jgi:hypothetical protein
MWRLFNSTDLICQEQYSSIEIDDLQAQENVTGIALKMQGSQRYFEGANGTDGMNDSATVMTRL